MEETLKEAARLYSERNWAGTLEALRDVDSTEKNHLDLAYLLGLVMRASNTGTKRFYTSSKSSPRSSISCVSISAASPSRTPIP